LRYGIVREVAGLPPPAQQRRLLQAAGCDVIYQEAAPTPDAQRRIARLLGGLKVGDAVLAYSLDAFQRTTGELAQLIRTLLELGVTLHILGEDQVVDALPPAPPVHRLLTLLADHEMRRPSRPPPGSSSSRNAGSRKPLSKFQIEYARKLHREGASLRMISLLFQVSPNEVWQVLGE
jgi:DNA invertase Pin-like site-specific DNA recombinase